MSKGQSIDEFIDAYWWNKGRAEESSGKAADRDCVSTAIKSAEIRIMKTKRSLPRKRTWMGLVFLLILVLPALYLAYHYTGGANYLLFGILLVFAAMMPFFLLFEGRKPQARELIILAVMVALGAAGRCAFYMFPNFKPVAAIVILTAVSFGSESGFLTGCLIMLISDIFMGMGPWTPWQMFSFGMVGFLAGILFHGQILKVRKVSLCIYGFLSVLLIYGGIMNPAAVLMSYGTLTKADVLAFYLSGLPMDAVQGVSTVIFLWLIGEPILKKLERVKLKYGLIREKIV